MSPLDTLIMLGGLAPFNRLNDEERLIVATVLRERHYAAGNLVQPAGEVWPHVLILVHGSWREGNVGLPRILGVASLVGGDKTAREVHAGPDGADCLLLEKGHFFTIANECPAVLLGLLSLADGDGETEKGFA